MAEQPDPAADRGAGRPAGRSPAPRPPPRYRQQARARPQQAGLAGAVRAEHHHHLAGCDREVDAGEGGEPAGERDGGAEMDSGGHGLCRHATGGGPGDQAGPGGRSAGGGRAGRSAQLLVSRCRPRWLSSSENSEDIQPSWPADQQRTEDHQDGPAHEVDHPQAPPGPAVEGGQAAEGQPGDHEGHPQARASRRTAAPRPGQRGPGRGQGQHGTQHRPDARGPGEGEGHAHHRRRPQAEGRGPDLEAPLAHDPGQRRRRGTGGQPRPGGRAGRPASEHQRRRRSIDAPAATVSVALVRAEQVPEPRGRRPEGHEDHGEPGHEQADAPRAAGRREPASPVARPASSSAADRPETMET